MFKTEKRIFLFFLFIFIICTILIPLFGCSTGFIEDIKKVEDFFLVKKEELIITRVMNSFFKAIMEEDFEKQKELTSEYALDYVNLQEFKHYYKFVKNKETALVKEAKVFEVKGDIANGAAYFEENFTKDNGYKFKTISGNKVVLKKIEGVWKIIDYDIDGRMLSDILYVINDEYKSQRNVLFSINNFYFFKN